MVAAEKSRVCFCGVSWVCAQSVAFMSRWMYTLNMDQMLCIPLSSQPCIVQLCMRVVME
jgi:hypothetical protein